MVGLVQMNEDVYNRSLDIWNYLKHDRLPKDKMEARKTRFKASRCTILNDQLYRRSTVELMLRRATNKSQTNQIPQETHDGEFENHSGGRRLSNQISRQEYYRPTLWKDSIGYVRNCDACQRHAGMSHKPFELLHSILVPWPFIRWYRTPCTGTKSIPTCSYRLLFEMDWSRCFLASQGLKSHIFYPY